MGVLVPSLHIDSTDSMIRRPIDQICNTFLSKTCNCTYVLTCSKIYGSGLMCSHVEYVFFFWAVEGTIVSINLEIWLKGQIIYNKDATVEMIFFFYSYCHVSLDLHSKQLCNTISPSPWFTFPSTGDWPDSGPCWDYLSNTKCICKLASWKYFLLRTYQRGSILQSWCGSK